jgi:hypothetical protein
MHDPKYLRDQARRSRALMKTAMEPEVIEQHQVWVVELAEAANEVERRSTRGDGGWRRTRSPRACGQ